MADAQKVLEEAIDEFALKARSWGKREELIELAKLAYEAGVALREGKPVSGSRARAVLPPSRTHDLN